LGRGFTSLDALEGASLVKNGPGDAGELVGERDRQHHNDYSPFYMVSLMFVAAFGTLAFSFWPYMIPFEITIDAAAAPPSTLSFMFWGEGLWSSR